MIKQHYVVSSSPGNRMFSTSAVALQAIIINSEEQVLLLSSPTRKQGWQVVSGALEAGETLLDSTLREVYEELGKDIRVRPLGTVHSETFHFDQNVKFMLGIYYLFAYLGEEILPTDDMVGSEFRWWSMIELENISLPFHPSTKIWMLKRGIELFRLWVGESGLPLQPPI